MCTQTTYYELKGQLNRCHPQGPAGASESTTGTQLASDQAPPPAGSGEHAQRAVPGRLETGFSWWLWGYWGDVYIQDWSEIFRDHEHADNLPLPDYKKSLFKFI